MQTCAYATLSISRHIEVKVAVAVDGVRERYQTMGERATRTSVLSMYVVGGMTL